MYAKFSGASTSVNCLEMVAYHTIHCIGVNISGRKSGTERTKKRKKLEFGIFPSARGATGTVVHRLDATWI